VGKSVFECLGTKVSDFLAFTDSGSVFVFGYLVGQQERKNDDKKRETHKSLLQKRKKKVKKKYSFYLALILARYL
jgi:nucleoside permease NupC